MRVARPWFSGNRQRSGAIKRVICVLQFDPAALGAVPRSESNLREFLGIRVSHGAARCGQASWVPSHARCHRRLSAPVVAQHPTSDTRRARTSTVDGRRSPGRRCACAQHCLADSSVSKRDISAVISRHQP